MVIYNVTISIDQHIAVDWLEWMRSKHIPDVLKTGCFLECKLSKLNGHEEGGLSYSVMYLAPNQDALDLYQNQYAAALQQEHLLRFDGKFAAFRTTLSVIETFNR